MRISMKKLMVSASAFAVISSGIGGFSTIAMAQDEAGSDDADEVRKFEKVVVTTRLREESLLDVPVSVTAFDGIQLEKDGVVAVDNLVGRVPNLFFSQNNTRSDNADNRALVIRGVGANPVLEPSVGVFVDGVYVPSLGFNLGLLDVQRVEILRGPQGSLFGRNTEGGAVSIITRQPDEQAYGRAFVEFDDLESLRAGASMAQPLVEDKLFLGLSVGGSHTDGFINNTFNGESANSKSEAAGRVTLRYTPTSATEIIFSADASVQRGNELGNGVDPMLSGSFDLSSDLDGGFEQDVFGANLKVEHDFNDLTFTSISGYRELESDRLFDTDGGTVLINNEQRTLATQESLSQEFRLSTQGDRAIDWLIGAYFYSEKERYNMISDFASFFGTPPTQGINTAFLVSEQERTGAALFGQANVSLFDDFVDVTLGARFSNDEVEGSRISRLTLPVFSLFRDVTGTRDRSYDNFSPTGQVVFNVSEGFKPYVNISQGYKGGGFERYPGSSDPYLPIDAETTTNYEVGAKGSLMGGQLTYAGAIFQVDIEDLQFPTLAINPDTGLPGTRLENAGSAKTEGVEFEFNYFATDFLTVNGSLGYTDAKFEDFVDADSNDRNGDQIPNVPELTYSLGADLDVPINSNVSFIGSLDLRYVDERISGLGTAGDPEFSYDSYELLDLTAGINVNDVEFSLFARNLTDEYVILNISAGSGVPRARPDAPRVIGARISTQW